MRWNFLPSVCLHCLLLLVAPLTGVATDKMTHSARPRARELGLRIGEWPTGAHNAITDVPGVRVGHFTLREGVLFKAGNKEN